MSKKILLIGGGGHCKSVLDSILELDQFSDIGIIDKKENRMTSVMGVPVIGCDDDLINLFREGYKNAFVTLGSIGNTRTRTALFHQLCQIGFDIPNIIDPSAAVSRRSRLEIGIYVGKNAVINAEARIKRGAIINTGAIIEHDCIVEEFAHIAPGAVLCGNVEIGANTHIGANSVVRQMLKVGSDSMIGIGSVILRDIESQTVAYGNPCKGVRSQ